MNAEGVAKAIAALFNQAEEEGFQLFLTRQGVRVDDENQEITARVLPDFEDGEWIVRDGAL